MYDLIDTTKQWFGHVYRHYENIVEIIRQGYKISYMSFDDNIHHWMWIFID